MTPKEINMSAGLKINQWKSPIWKSIKSGTALYTNLSNKFPNEPPSIIKKKYFLTSFNLNNI